LIDPAPAGPTVLSPLTSTSWPPVTAVVATVEENSPAGMTMV
jgi:hypothetical protein